MLFLVWFCFILIVLASLLILWILDNYDCAEPYTSLIAVILIVLMCLQLLTCVACTCTNIGA